jgi:hypothetical protein
MTRLALVLAAALVSSCAHVTPRAPSLPAASNESNAKEATSDRRLKPFTSMDELRERMASVVEARRIAHEKEEEKRRAECREQARSDTDIELICASGLALTESVAVAGAALRSITNNQHEGVDEGDIVKRQGDVLIVLRRGRLFTIGIGGGQLDSLAIADAYGPASDGIEPNSTWYDELLVWHHTIIVVGYSYDRGGTEIGLFELGDDGELQYRATYHVRSDDYYSRGNYASRLIGDRLVFFSSRLVPEDVDPNTWLPKFRRWGPPGLSGSFETIAPINRVFQPAAPLGANPGVHSLITCNLATASLDCEATVVLGDPLTEYYASPTAAYIWTTEWNDDRPSARSVLYRMPFDGALVSAIGVTGQPPDQLAFLEDAHEHLNVVVADNKADEDDNRVVSLLRLPLYLFSDGSLDAPASYYRPIATGVWVVARFVGPYVLVGTPADSYDNDDKGDRRVVVTRWEEGTSTVSLKLTHRVERIEAMGAHAVVVGGDDNDDGLFMSAIRLGNRPTVADTLVLKDASQAEYRSHAFVYRQDTRDDGIFGLPVDIAGDDYDRWDRPARLVFIQNHGLAFSMVGTLNPSPAKPIDDRCRASCVDWYGNARPIFIDGRVFALSGYELVEGRFTNGRMKSVGRLDFIPSALEPETAEQARH